MPAVQKYLGQNWPSEKLAAEDDLQGQERSIQAFRFVYRILRNYISNPYKPKGSEVCGVSLKVRARVPHSKAYLEDTFDLILWHPERRTLELVDFHLSPLKPFDPAWGFRSYAAGPSLSGPAPEKSTLALREAGIYFLPAAHRRLDANQHRA